MDWEESGAPKGDGGFHAAPAKKGGRGKKLLIALVVLVLVCVIGGKACSGKKVEKIEWPKTGLAAMLPEPPSEYGHVSMFSTSISATFEETSYDDYSAYVSSCKELGFTVDAVENNTSYDAKNADGYALSVDSYSDSMSVSLKNPSDDAQTPAAAPAAPAASEEAQPTENVETEEASGSSASEASARDAIDEYEAFMDEYVDFMVKYKESGNAASMLVDYGKMMKRYSDMSKKFEALGDGSMSDADAAYYLEVQNRVNQKLLDAAI